jgi:hypothetical protein
MFRKAVRPQVAESARVATFLASEGIALNNEAYALLGKRRLDPTFSAAG